MPEYRKLHNSFDMGERTDKLTDFELRVWLVYRACADDFGVCPFLPGLLKGKSRRLARVADKVMTRAMERLVTVALCISFAHQGLRYLCQANWQDKEDIRYPKVGTPHPAPPPEVLREFTEKTQQLFREFHPSSRSLPYAGVRKTQALTETPTETKMVLEESPRETNPGPRHHAPSAAGMSPLRWGNLHGEHVTGFCDWKCFPQEQANQFAAQLAQRDGGSLIDASSEVVLWARSVRASGIIPTGKMFDFWNGQWQRTHGTSTPVAEGAAGRQARTNQRLDKFVEEG